MLKFCKQICIRKWALFLVVNKYYTSLWLPMLMIRIRKWSLPVVNNELCSLHTYLNRLITYIFFGQFVRFVRSKKVILTLTDRDAQIWLPKKIWAWFFFTHMEGFFKTWWFNHNWPMFHANAIKYTPKRSWNNFWDDKVGTFLCYIFVQRIT